MANLPFDRFLFLLLKAQDNPACAQITFQLGRQSLLYSVQSEPLAMVLWLAYGLLKPALIHPMQGFTLDNDLLSLQVDQIEIEIPAYLYLQANTTLLNQPSLQVAFPTSLKPSPQGRLNRICITIEPESIS